MTADQLTTAQDLTHLLKTVASWFWVVPLLLAALAVWLARGRRRTTVRALAIGAVIAGLLVLIVRSLVGSYFVHDVVKTDTVRPAASETWDILTQLLADGAWTLIVVALIALLGVWLAGPTRRGTEARRWLAPYLARPEIAFGAAALFVLLIVWWGPTPQTRRWYLMLTAVVLLALGVEALRRLTAREFPAAAASEPAAEPPAVPSGPAGPEATPDERSNE
jgi:uncharacterized BrkB/YihY/UPF0761 family membrane protein